MRLQTSLGVTALVSALLASPVYAENCGISYYCYRSMTPGAAPVEPVATSRPNPNGTRPTNLQQARPVNTQPTRTVVSTTRPTPQTTEAQRLAAQQRAQSLADQQRLTNLRRTQPTNRVAPPQPSRRTAPSVAAVFRPVDTQSCNTLSLKIKVLESQAAGHARNQQQAKAQELFKVAADLRKAAQTKSCTV